jgi:hypothetical protein
MIKLSYTREMVNEAKILADEMGELKNSITKGCGTKAGFLGEIAICNYLGAKKESKFNHDLLLGDLKIEVKSKRRCGNPKDFYEGSVALSSGHQHPDFFAFLSLTFEGKRVKQGSEHYFGLESVWYCGMISYEEFMEKSTIHKKGERDPLNGFVVIADMRNIPYSYLKC